MFPASTKAGGMCFAFPDVCKVPTPAGPIPVPFPNIAMCSNAAIATTKVKIENMPVLHKGTIIPMSMGDEPGVAGGVISGVNMSQMAYRTFTPTVMVEGNNIVTFLKVTGHNGASANMPAGSQIVPSQAKVIIGA